MMLLLVLALVAVDDGIDRFTYSVQAYAVEIDPDLTYAVAKEALKRALLCRLQIFWQLVLWNGGERTTSLTLESHGH
jgi:hypothetical protein